MARPEDTPETAAPPPEKAAGGKLMLIMLALQVALIGAVAWLYVRPPVDPNAVEEEIVEEEEEPEPLAPPIYFAMDPAFVVNLQDDKRLRFLQVTVQLMTRVPEVEASIEQNAPMLRNSLLMLFSAQRMEDVASVEGKERLRSAALEQVRTLLAENGVAGDVEALYFTSFVVQ